MRASRWHNALARGRGGPSAGRRVGAPPALRTHTTQSTEKTHTGTGREQGTRERQHTTPTVERANWQEDGRRCARRAGTTHWQGKRERQHATPTVERACWYMFLFKFSNQTQILLSSPVFWRPLPDKMAVQYLFVQCCYKHFYLFW